MNLMHGDCLEMMKLIPDGSVDLTVTSPPYDNLRTYNDSLNDWGPAKWEAVLEELWRLTKPGGVVVWVVADATLKGSETGTSFRQALFAIQCGFKLHDTMIYEKNGGGARGSIKAYWQCYEFMFVLVKGELNTFNPLEDRPNVKAGKTYKTGGRRNIDGTTTGTKLMTAAEFGKRKNIWRIGTGRNVSTSDAEAFQHPAIFPEALAADHIQSWSNPGDIVFDPFLGSGTTGKMAVLASRQFIGIERDDKYFAIAQKRIEDALYGDLV